MVELRPAVCGFYRESRGGVPLLFRHRASARASTCTLPAILMGLPCVCLPGMLVPSMQDLMSGLIHTVGFICRQLRNSIQDSEWVILRKRGEEGGIRGCDGEFRLLVRGDLRFSAFLGRTNERIGLRASPVLDCIESVWCDDPGFEYAWFTAGIACWNPRKRLARASENPDVSLVHGFESG